jgi:hypothetical protein
MAGMNSNVTLAANGIGVAIPEPEVEQYGILLSRMENALKAVSEMDG